MSSDAVIGSTCRIGVHDWHMEAEGKLRKSRGRKQCLPIFTWMKDWKWNKEFLPKERESQFRQTGSIIPSSTSPLAKEAAGHSAAGQRASSSEKIHWACSAAACQLYPLNNAQKDITKWTHSKRFFPKQLPARRQCQLEGQVSQQIFCSSGWSR